MVTIRYIPNILSNTGRESKELKYSREKSILEFIREAGYPENNIRVIISGKRATNLKNPVDNSDEIIITPDVSGSAIGAFIAWVVTKFIEHWIIYTVFIVSTAYSIYSYSNMPKTPNFGTSGTGLDEGSQTYSWDGIQTIQEVGVPVPVVYGTHRVGGNIINSYIFTSGDKNYLNLLIALCEGEIEDIDSIKINDNPITNYQGTTSAQVYDDSGQIANNAEIYKRYGTNAQSLIPAFEDLHSSYNVNVPLNTKDSYHVYTTTGIDIEGFEVGLTMPNGLFMQDETNGAIMSHSVTYKVEYKLHADPGYTLLATITVSEKSRTSLRRVVRKEGLTAGQYDIKVTRTSDTDDFYHTSLLTFSTLDELNPDDLIYPNTALLGLRLLATEQLSGSTPNITTLVKGKKISAPVVMNGAVQVAWEDYYWNDTEGEFRLLDGDTSLTWDGSFADQYCANPIWCLKDLLINNRYGLGEFIDGDQIDDDLFEEMAKYCEEKLADGAGGYEKRFVMNIVIDSDTRALDLLVQLSSAFRGIIFYSGGKIKIRIDKAEDASQLFGMGNIVNGSFAQSWKSLKEVPNVIEVQFLNEDTDYRQEIVSVMDETAIANGDPIRKKQIRLYVTKLSYALREARYALDVARYINRAISFKAGIDAVAVTIGDIINISHDVPQWGFSGRVQADSTVDLVKLDRSVVIEAGKTYKIEVRFADDTIEERTISDGAGTYTELGVTVSFSQAPASYDVFAVGESDIQTKPFRVIGVKRENKDEVTISATEYNASVYDDTAPAIPTNNYSALSTDIPPVTDLALTERLVLMPDGSIQDEIDVWWDKPDTADYFVKRADKFRIYISDDAGANYKLVGETRGSNFAIIGGIEDLQTYYIKVTSVSEIDEETDLSGAPSATITVVGKTAPPSNVTGFSVAYNNGMLTFSWNEISDIDRFAYEIRQLPFSGADWALGTVIATNITELKKDVFNFTAGTKYYAIKAIDTTGNYSTTEATDSITITSIPDSNVIETWAVDVAKEGTLSGDAELEYILGLSNDYFRLAVSLMSEDRWDDGSLWDAGDTWDTPVSTATGTYTTPVKDLGASFQCKIDLDIGLLNTEGGKLTIQIAYSDSDPTIGSAEEDWKNYSAGQYTGRYFRFRFIMDANDVNYKVSIYSLTVTFDVPDKEQQGKEIATDAGSYTTITLTGFASIKTIILSALGAYVCEIEKDGGNIKGLPSYFNVRTLDPADGMAQIADKINYYVKGY